MSNDTSAWVRQWVEDFIRREMQPARVDAWVVRTNRAILGDVPELGERPELAAGIDVGIREHWIAFLEELMHSPMRFHLVARAARVALGAASTSLPLEALGRVYRGAQKATWNYEVPPVGGEA